MSRGRVLRVRASEAIEDLRERCLRDADPVPQGTLGLGTPFKCRQCGSELVIDKVKPFAATAIYIPLALWARKIGYLIPILLLLAASMLTWQFATVRLAKRPQE